MYQDPCVQNHAVRRHLQHTRHPSCPYSREAGRPHPYGGKRGAAPAAAGAAGSHFHSTSISFELAELRAPRRGGPENAAALQVCRHCSSAMRESVSAALKQGAPRPRVGTGATATLQGSMPGSTPVSTPLILAALAFLYRRLVPC